ncbi:response regulator transcription factor [Marinicaulis aureus]|uniref:Response regulator transcription factor n=1 Tax=Hyphococcus aureus TaxID=2666033 RepID=A0ABW1KVY9_9PROT
MKNLIATANPQPVRFNESEYRLDDLIGRHGKDIHLASVLAYERLAAMPFEEKVHPKLLSNRERECLTWLCAGLRVVAIAEKLSISNSAVNLYINNAKNKLGAKTREQAVARALISSEITL